MKKTVVIKRRYEFKKLFNKGNKFFGRNIILYIIKNKYENNRIGIAVGKKCGKAVDRNKIKRLIRENYKIYENSIRVGYDLLFYVSLRDDIKSIDYYNVKDDFDRLLKKSDMIENKDEKNISENN